MTSTYTLKANGERYEVMENGEAISMPLEMRKAADLLRRFENGANWGNLSWEERTVEEILADNGLANETVEEPAAEQPAHVCDEEAERKMYGRYVDDGIASTDGWYIPEDFETWRSHYHRGIGHFEPRTEECTDTECKAPSHERVKCVQIVKRRKCVKMFSVCRECYDSRHRPRRAAA
ncbi:hypothetical protein [Streptomyces sp. TRM68367]|uniref:hypothetical protein n=1 Tax=Streptomyces sp. TRM68367 TaxID=2758415 RepID=UPI00165B0CDC|nr:hypothetical protein [Streptomyces sp. TRM68367]MBC9731225.1 hypothetical protein [Streptomyces sp. TRM68367]